MRETPSIQSEIVWLGRSSIVGLPAIAALLHQGLTPHDYTTLALVADQYSLTVAELMRLALEGGR
jgi:hypothetical protein